MSEQLPQQIIEAMQTAMADGIQQIYDRSQRYVNVKTGRLKRSGRLAKALWGGTVTYSAPYAAAVEDGTTEQWVKVHASRRSEHKRSQRGYRSAYANWVAAGGRQPVRRWSKVQAHKVSGYWRHVKGRKGYHYLGRAVDETLPQLPAMVAANLNHIRSER